MEMVPDSTYVLHAILGKVADSLDVDLSRLQETVEDLGA